MEEHNKIKLELDPELLLETVAFFERHKDEDIPAYDFATALLNCDRTVDLPRCLFDFIEDLYKNAIADGNIYAMNDLGALYYIMKLRILLKANSM